MPALYIKNMVCKRCVQAVDRELTELGLRGEVGLGEVHLQEELSPEILAQLRTRLDALGFELLDDQRSRLIEKVKTLLIERVQSGELPEHFSLVDFLSKALHRDYSAVSKLFTEVEGITLEQFFILQKTEKVKELLVYNELSLSEIAFRLGYSSVAYLSSQFKKVTGMTPTAFKTGHRGLRRALDEVRSH
jgi:AraC-like DNA-binding protein